MKISSLGLKKGSLVTDDKNPLDIFGTSHHDAMNKSLQRILVLGLTTALMTGGLILPLPQIAYAVTCGSGIDNGSGVCVTVLTSGTSFTVPSDWNSSSNSIEVIGGGGGGGLGLDSGNPSKHYGGGGGGGAAYSKITNLTLTPTDSISYTIGAGGAIYSAGGSTWFNGASCGAASAC